MFAMNAIYFDFKYEQRFIQLIATFQITKYGCACVSLVCILPPLDRKHLRLQAIEKGTLNKNVFLECFSYMLILKILFCDHNVANIVLSVQPCCLLIKKYVTIDDPTR